VKDDAAVDEQGLQAILEADRTMKAIDGAIVAMENFAKGRKHIFLDEEHHVKIRRKAQSLRETAEDFIMQITDEEQ
jgi:hypothetical protein